MIRVYPPPLIAPSFPITLNLPDLRVPPIALISPNLLISLSLPVIRIDQKHRKQTTFPGLPTRQPVQHPLHQWKMTG